MSCGAPAARFQKKRGRGGEQRRDHVKGCENRMHTARLKCKTTKVGKRKFFQDKYDSEMFNPEELQASH